MVDDAKLRTDVEAELEWDPRFDSRQIGVAVKNGIVALSGQVSTYMQRRAAEEAALAVAGVRAIANDIVIELPWDSRRSDADIADSALEAISAHVALPASALKIIVRSGWITLDGEVPFWYQKNAAESAVSALRGVRGITNNIAIRPSASAADIQTRIEDAFRRRAHIDAQNIRVHATGSTVTLEGQVHSWQEREQAKAAAWQAPGVSQVLDKLTVHPN